MIRLKHIILTVAVLLVLTDPAAAERPNVIVVLADDIGVGDISLLRRLHSGNIILETPNLDSLAAGGMIFTQAHSPAALCAPSRYGVMTGNNCYRSHAPWGVWGAYQESPIRDTDLTLGRLMKKAGYHTAFFGKWHLGGDYYRKDEPGVIYREPRVAPELDVDITLMLDGPKQKGFDYSITFPGGIQAAPYAVYENEHWMPLKEDSEIAHITQDKMDQIGVTLDKGEGLGDTNWDPHDMGPLLADKAVAYINDHASQEDPFFIYYCSQAVHVPHTPPDSLDGTAIAGTTPSKHMDMIRELDVQMGMMMDALKANGIYENTIVLFTSDNGGLQKSATLASGHQPSSIYRGGKNSRFEGGHRVPFIVSWPDSIAAGQSTDMLVSGTDIMATLAAITGEETGPGQALDSYNLLPVLQEGAGIRNTGFLMLQGGSGKEIILQDQEWKLIMQSDNTGKMREPIALFDLNTNPQESESGNFINDPAYRSRIDSMLEKYIYIRDSRIPTGNFRNIHIPFDHEHLYYEGRIGRDTVLEASEIWWPGSSVSMKFIGDSITAILEDQNGDNYFNVIIDDSLSAVLHLAEGKATYVLASELEFGEHTVELHKRNDWSYGWTRFHGFNLRGLNTIPSEPKELFIEFYGNSITTGYGNEDTTDLDRPTGDVTNNYLAYGAITARNMDAEYSCVSHSGIGIMVSWHNVIMPEEYYRQDPSDPASRWSFADKQADIVVVNLFQNDSWLVKRHDHNQFIRRFGTTAPTPEETVNAYVAFLDSIRAEYPAAEIICLLGNMDITQAGSPWPGYVSDAAAIFNDRVHTLFVPYKNSPGHPKVAEQKIIADRLTGYILDLNDTIKNLSLRLTNAYTGEPVSGANINIGGKELTTNYDGSIKYPVRRGNYEINISHDRYADQSFPLNIATDTILHIEMDQSLANAKFVVRMNSAGLFNATVDLAGQSGLTNSVGLVNFFDLQTDTTYVYQIKFESEVLVADTVSFLADTTLWFDFISSTGSGKAEEVELRLFPNPTTGSLRIEGIDGIYSYEIRDIRGRAQHTGTGNPGESIDVSELPAGPYFFRIDTYPTLLFFSTGSD